ncbi:hypothetical protein ACFLRF_03300 [Candidatus Altiarchaeota archaeon]
MSPQATPTQRRVLATEGSEHESPNKLQLMQIRDRDEKRIRNAEKHDLRSGKIPKEVQDRIDSIGVVGFQRALKLVRSSRAGRRARLEGLKKIYDEGTGDTRQIITENLDEIGVDLAAWHSGRKIRKSPELLAHKQEILTELLTAGARPLVAPEFIAALAYVHGMSPYEYETRKDGSTILDGRGNPQIRYVRETDGLAKIGPFGRPIPVRTEFMEAYNAAMTIPQQVISGSLKFYADILGNNMLAETHDLLLNKNPRKGVWTTQEMATALNLYERHGKDPGSQKDQTQVMNWVTSSAGILQWMGLVKKYPQDSHMGVKVSARYIHTAHYEQAAGLPEDNVDYWILKTLHKQGPTPGKDLHSPVHKRNRTIGARWALFNEGAVKKGLGRMELDGLVQSEGSGRQVIQLTPAGRGLIRGQEESDVKAGEEGRPPYLTDDLRKALLGSYREGLNGEQVKTFHRFVRAVTTARMIEGGSSTPDIVRTMNPELNVRGSSMSSKYYREHAHVEQIRSRHYPWDPIKQGPLLAKYVQAFQIAEDDDIIPEGHTQWLRSHLKDKLKPA